MIFGAYYFLVNFQTFRPKKKFPIGTLRYNLHKQAQATLHSGLDLKAAVRLPPNENFEDWLAVHSKSARLQLNIMATVNCNR